MARDRVEIIVDGINFHRYPDAPKRNSQVYFWGQVNGETKSLHSYLWERENGAILKGFDVHHINGDPLDNRIENLELVEHDRHAGMLDHSKRVVPKTCINCGNVYTGYKSRETGFCSDLCQHNHRYKTDPVYREQRKERERERYWRKRK